jgi:hypothetical protein
MSHGIELHQEFSARTHLLRHCMSAFGILLQVERMCRVQLALTCAGLGPAAPRLPAVRCGHQRQVARWCLQNVAIAQLLRTSMRYQGKQRHQTALITRASWRCERMLCCVCVAGHASRTGRQAHACSTSRCSSSCATDAARSGSACALPLQLPPGSCKGVVRSCASWRNVRRPWCASAAHTASARSPSVSATSMRQAGCLTASMMRPGSACTAFRL